ncbi:MAG: SDR family NAD(P)-dependent oxidoreductase [Pseudomonadales bacterium]
MSVQQGAFDTAQLADQVAVVTGAGNNGIGWGICRHAAGQLKMHVLIIDLHENLVQSAVERLRAEFPAILVSGMRCDVTRPEDLQWAAKQVSARFPGKDIGAVFANAGVIFNKTIMKSSIEHWRTTLDVNIMGVLHTIQAFVPLLQAQSCESIFSTTASVGGLVRGDAGAASYQASKHAVVAMTESLSYELAVKSPQIRFHVLCPCIVGTALGETSRINRMVKTGDLDEAQVHMPQAQSIGDLAQTPDAHARQVFDHIAAGNFYMITENKRPYVDHDFPFDAEAIIQERMEGVLKMQLDNSDALNRNQGRQTSSILKGPLFQEVARRAANHSES